MDHLGSQYHTTTTTMFLWWLCWWYFVLQAEFHTETHCCQGYLKDVLGRCVAQCDGGCANGVCRSPNNCTCYPGYTLDRSGNCVVECPCGCLNGVCAGIAAPLFACSLVSVTSNSLFCLLWSGDPLCTYLTIHVHKSFYQSLFQTYKLTEKWLFSGAQMVNTSARKPTACLVFSSDTPATFVFLCNLTTNQQLGAHVCIQMQVSCGVMLVFFPVPTLEKAKALVTSHFCV